MVNQPDKSKANASDENTPAGPVPKKPKGQSWESFADSLIRKAQREGAFDNLAGAGKPLPNMDKPYDPMSWVKQFVERENLQFAPGFLETKRLVERELEKVLDRGATEASVRRVVRELNAAIGKTNAGLTSGPASTLAKLNEEEVVARWRRRQDAKKCGGE